MWTHAPGRPRETGGAALAVYGPAPWAAPCDQVDVEAAAFLALYADRVVGDGLPGAVAAR